MAFCLLQEFHSEKVFYFDTLIFCLWRHIEYGCRLLRIQRLYVNDSVKIEVGKYNSGMSVFKFYP